MQSEEREVKEKMSTQKLASKKPQIGKRVLIAAIAVSSLTLLFVLLDFHLLADRVAILYFPLSWVAAILYLTREKQAAAARAWGILGGFALILFVSYIAIPAFFMAIGGGALALRRPKLAGVLMLVGAIMSMAGLLYIVLLAMGWGEGVPLLMVTSPLLVTSFLIPGGILALTSRAGQGASKKMVIGAIAVLFGLPLLPVLPFHLIPY